MLLVKLSYAHRRWSIPGGGVKSNETFYEAACRELQEETGIETELTYFGTYQQHIEYKHDTVECFWGYVENPTVVIDNVEVAEYGWFERDDLPEPITPSVRKILNIYDARTR